MMEAKKKALEARNKQIEKKSKDLKNIVFIKNNQKFMVTNKKT